VLIVLYLGGHRYPLGPSRDWIGWLADLANTLGPEYEIAVSPDEQSATMRARGTEKEVYRLTLEPWPTEREVWIGGVG
jgi:hypothetical protein